MRPFTYKDYIYYKNIFKEKRKNYILQLCDTNEVYSYEREKVDQPHDKIFKEVLDDKEETIKLINEMLRLENTEHALQKNDIEKYNRKFITDDFYNMESDVIYKKKNQNIFFLIEHQSRIDYSMPYRILKYNMAIMESAIDNQKIGRKHYKLPSIFSFVIYTGEKKWNASQYLIEKQEKLAGCKQSFLGNFQLIDVNDYTKEELLNSERLLFKMMLLEKAKNMEDLERYLDEITEEKMEKKQVDFIRRVVNYILNDKKSYR